MHFFHVTSASLTTITNRDVQREGHWADDQEVSSKPTESWVRSMEKVANVTKDTETFIAVKEAEKNSARKPE